jgi:hypothetical protein
MSMFETIVSIRESSNQTRSTRVQYPNSNLISRI